jgi:DNA/RNA endonuclease YhcR with UshA esterase domain
MLAFSAPAQPASTNSTAAAAPTRVIGTAQAAEFIGYSAVVTGKVAEVHFGAKAVNINLDRAFPNHPFGAVVFAAKTNLFAGLEKLQGKQVEVSGKITEYREKPQIILTSTNQLKVLAD